MLATKRIQTIVLVLMMMMTAIQMVDMEEILAVFYKSTNDFYYIDNFNILKF
jgi:hypothetical protein